MRLNDLTHTAGDGSRNKITTPSPAKKQKKWVPPLQQMLDLLKQSVATEKPASNQPILAAAVDPAMALAESTEYEGLSICQECGHLNLPMTLESEKASRIQQKWDRISSHITGNTPKCDNH
jgi:hypothetical protein